MIGSDQFADDIDIDEFINKMLTSLPKLNSIDSKITLYDFYEHQFGIYPHLNNPMKSPLSSVAMHDPEDFNTGSLLEEAIRTYNAKGIKDMYGLNVLEFLDLPIDIIDMMITIANEEQANKQNILNDIQRDMKDK